MCKFIITDNQTKKNITCVTAWDIFNTVANISNEIEAQSVWKKAGHINIGDKLLFPQYTIQRAA